MTEEQREVFHAAALILCGTGTKATHGDCAEAVQQAIKLWEEVHRATDPRVRYKGLPDANRPSSTGDKP